MSYKPYEQIFCVSEEEKALIDNFYEKSEEDILKMVRNLKKWTQTQPHLPKNQEDYFYEMMLKLNKFNEEKTQNKIDMYFTMRNIIPEFYEHRSSVCSEMKKFMDTLMILPLPNLTLSLERIYIIKFINDNPCKFDLIQNARYLMALFDVRLKYDLAVGERYIYDLSGLRFGHMLKINPVTIKKIYNAMQKAYSDRIKGIHFLNMPMVGSALISLAKMILSEKLANRVQCHKNVESLKETIPAKLLPVDYNGSQESLEKLYARWREVFENSADWIEEIGRQKSNEELRLKTEENTSIITGLFSMFSR